MSFNYRFKLDGSLWTIGEMHAEHCVIEKGRDGTTNIREKERMIVSRKITMLSMEGINNFAEMTLDENSLFEYFEEVVNEHS